MKDILNQDLVAGDDIVMSFGAGRSSYLRTGRIMEIVKTEDWSGTEIEKLLVHWSVGYRVPDKDTLITNLNGSNVLKITTVRPPAESMIVLKNEHN